MIKPFMLAILFLPHLALAEQKCLDTAEVTTPGERFSSLGDSSVLDTQTQLVWKKCLEGVRGNSCADDSEIAMTWAESLQYVARVHDETPELGWRLPNIRELSTLVELQCVNPAIRLSLFPNMPVTHVWTSSPYHFYTHYSWYVDFSSGTPTYDERIRKKSLLLVRDNKTL